MEEPDRLTPEEEPEEYEEETEEYEEAMAQLSGLIVNHPERIDEIRESLAFSAKYMVSSPEDKAGFQSLVEDMDAFLSACKTGELDPQEFLKKEKK